MCSQQSVGEGYGRYKMVRASQNLKGRLISIRKLKVQDPKRTIQYTFIKFKKFLPGDSSLAAKASQLYFSSSITSYIIVSYSQTSLFTSNHNQYGSTLRCRDHLLHAGTNL